MDEVSSVFPYEKSIILNVLYDTLESMGFKIGHVNSERGTIIADSTEYPRSSIRIACNGIPPENKSIVRIYTNNDNTQKRLSDVIIDEIEATIQRSLTKQSN